jgi:endonuclease/exonuclease/phosphatase family metal-dependent hydrolase
MGKKAVNLLIHTMLITFTLLMAVFTVLAMFGAVTSPENCGFMALLALGLPGLLIVDLLLAVYWAFRRRLLLLLPLLCLAANYEYYPRVFQLPSREVPAAREGAPRLKVAAYNVNYFRYDENMTNTVSFMSHFMKQEKVDVLCIQEFAEHKELYPIDSIAAAFDLPYRALGVNSVGYNDLAVLSRYPLTGANRMIFKDSPNSAMWVDVMVDGGPVRVINAHLQTTSVNWEKDDLQRQIALGTAEDQARAAIRMSNIMTTNFRRRAMQADHIKQMVDTTSIPVVLCGDINDTPSSYVYNVLTGGGALFTDKPRLKDGFLEAGKGYAYTYHNLKRILRIDYVIHTPDLRGVEYSSPNLNWSDHNPVVMDLQLPIND